MEMGDAPALWNIKMKQLAERLRCGAGDGVSPCPEGNKLLTGAVKGELSVHHGGYANRGDGSDIDLSGPGSG